MNNVAGHPEHRETLAKLRGAYEQFLDTWSKECVQIEDFVNRIQTSDQRVST